jgi:hypothetical protein
VPDARLRNVIGGTSTAKGLKEYLILLSISETCKSKGIRFLDFLLSGETDVDQLAKRPGYSRSLVSIASDNTKITLSRSLPAISSNQPGLCWPMVDASIAWAALQDRLMLDYVGGVRQAEVEQERGYSLGTDKKEAAID